MLHARQIVVGGGFKNRTIKIETEKDAKKQNKLHAVDDIHFKKKGERVKPQAN